MEQVANEKRETGEVYREERTIEGFFEFETDRSFDLIVWHLERKKTMPPDILRAVTFFLMEDDPVSLKILFEADVISKTPIARRSHPLFEQCCWRYRQYAKLLHESWLSKIVNERSNKASKE
jgi:hypothetical protein